MGAFFIPAGENRYRSTQHTVGPWNAESQHLGPPSALLVREFERTAPREDAHLARVTFEVLGPVPVAELEVHAEVERPGRSVELLRGELRYEGRAVLAAKAWRIVTSDTEAVRAGAPPRVDPPDAAEPMRVPEGWGGGYLAAVEWLALRGGGIFTPGDATVWGRPKVETVDGEQASPLQKLFAIADSASGVSSRLDIRKWFSINTDLSVHLFRQPTGEWFALEANTVIGPDGVGVAASVLHDETGPVGRTAQALFVRERGSRSG
ncbi:thioesterase family protein [Lentzea tibetensis]|uniref:Thioesterase family protein n=1 Tax=Lentzea tibetensis TaxID=2591470 RepID=A0A563EG53_9PSEU|nr:thioesterase family protein [Lentzea tibetensis]